MRGISTVDGFVEISECLAEMIKYIANEPSVGLFFIQQHTQNAVPNVIKTKNNIVEKSHETTLHREDLEDSVTMVRSMKECGFPIVDEMIGDIKKTLVTMSSKRGAIDRSASNFQTRKTSFWGNSAVDAQEDSEKGSNYFSSVFTFSKKKESSLHSSGSVDSMIEKAELYPNVPLLVKSASTGTSSQGMEADMQGEDESQQEESDIGNKLLSVVEKYDDFKASKEAKLKEWLEGTSDHEK